MDSTFVTKPLVKPPDYSLRAEIRGGITTFLTMAYIVLLNPAILSTQGTGLSFSGTLTSTVLLCFFMTLLMGLYAKLPFGVAPGMGVNAFFTFSIVLGAGVPAPIALGIVFWAGVAFLILSVTRIRDLLANAIPRHLRVASAAGIGCFLAFIGLKNGQIITPDPDTFVKFFPLHQESLLAIFGLFIACIFMARRNSWAFLIAIALVTLAGFALGIVKPPEHFVSWPDFRSNIGLLDIKNSLDIKYLPTLMAIMLTDFFDSISTFMGVSQATGLMDEKGEPLRMRQGLIVDAFATLGAGLLGTSSGTAFIESAAGIHAGARTGIASVVTAFCFLPCLFIAPLAAIIPDFATAPILILVGAMMFQSLFQIKIRGFEELIPAFLSFVLIPLTFSITQGILWGILSHVVLFAVSADRRRELTPLSYVLALLCVGMLTLY